MNMNILGKYSPGNLHSLYIRELNTGEEPYDCEQCNTLSQKSHLTVHLSTHTGKKQCRQILLLEGRAHCTSEASHRSETL